MDVFAWCVARLAAQQSLLPDGVVGRVGDFLAGWFLTPLWESGAINPSPIQQPIPVRAAEGRRHPVRGR
ncbi:MAG: hypothetical protein ACK4SA_17495, partial [Caldilinea sp.]